MATTTTAAITIQQIIIEIPVFPGGASPISPMLKLDDGSSVQRNDPNEAGEPPIEVLGTNVKKNDQTCNRLALDGVFKGGNEEHSAHAGGIEDRT